MSDLLIQAADLRSLVEQILQGYLLTEEQARIVADIYVTADLRGIHSHGVSRICSFLLPLLRQGRMDIAACYLETILSPTQKQYNGNRALGPVTSYFAMNDCLRMANKEGVGVVSVTNSTHFGLASYYSLMASRQGYVGIVITNGSPAVVPPGANKSVLGTNALSIAFPNGTEPIVLDIALSSTSLGKLFNATVESETVPSEWCSSYLLRQVQVEQGQRMDPRIIYENRAIAPLGSGDGEYKGFNLGLMVDLFLSLLFGGKLSCQTEQGEASHVFIAVNPEIHSSRTHYHHVIDVLYQQLESLEYLEGVERYRIPGTRSNETYRKYLAEGIPLKEKTYYELLQEAKMPIQG